MTNNNRIFLWDGTRKPVWETLDEASITTDDITVEIASFDTTPFRDVEEYQRYADGMEIFVRKYGHRPLSKRDFVALKSIVGE